MSLAIIHSRANLGILAPEVTIEAHISNGIPSFSIVGLPETAVKESRERVRSALLNSNFEFPARRITVNLAPADLPKEGGRFDLPIALGILVASDQLKSEILDQYEFAGELALSGELRAITGALPFAIACGKAKRKFILPLINANEAALPISTTVLPARHLLDVCAHFANTQLLKAHEIVTDLTPENHADLTEVRGQTHAKRALEIAAAGGHNLLFIGPPGTGKTMLASRLPSILPLLNHDEAIEVASIASISNQFKLNKWRHRPFRSPHHTTSSVALVGGSSPPRPGEITLAHHGVLFLDELPEFNRHALETLREPLESGTITIARAARNAEFPAQFQLIAAMNPCPCGHLGNPKNECQCSTEKIQRYRAKLSAPLLDRIDIHIEVPPLPQGLLTETPVGETSATVRERVTQARNKQLKRSGKINHQLRGKQIEKFCVISQADKQFMEKAIDQLKLSARAYHSILRVARTIADLADRVDITTADLTEALSYRRLDRKIKY